MHLVRHALHRGAPRVHLLLRYAKLHGGRGRVLQPHGGLRVARVPHHGQHGSVGLRARRVRLTLLDGARASVEPVDSSHHFGDGALRHFGPASRHRELSREPAQLRIFAEGQLQAVVERALSALLERGRVPRLLFGLSQVALGLALGVRDALRALLDLERGIQKREERVHAPRGFSSVPQTTFVCAHASAPRCRPPRPRVSSN